MRENQWRGNKEQPTRIGRNPTNQTEPTKSSPDQVHTFSCFLCGF